MRLAARRSIYNMTKAPATARGPLREAWSSCLVMTLVLVLNLTVPAHAHDHHGPPLQIIADQRVGPYLVSVWDHPMVGTGTFFVAVKSPSGNTVPDDLKVEIGIQPASGRLPEKSYVAQRESSSDQAQYQVEAAFDAQEIWRVRISTSTSVITRQLLQASRDDAGAGA